MCLGLNRQNRKDRAGQAEQDKQKNMQNRTGRIGQAEQDL
jgi:hypothetical protein